MLKIMDLSESERQELLDQPMSDEEAEALHRINESDRWLLAENLREMDRRDAEPATDPTCVLVMRTNDED